MFALMYQMLGYSTEIVEQKISSEVKQVEQQTEEKPSEFILLKEKVEQCEALVLQLKKEKAEQVKVKAAVEAYVAANEAYQAAKIAKGLVFVPPASPSPETVDWLKQKLDQCTAVVRQVKSEHAELDVVKAAVDAYIAARSKYKKAEAAINKLTIAASSSSSSQRSQSSHVANSLHSPRNVLPTVTEAAPAIAPVLSRRPGN